MQKGQCPVPSPCGPCGTPAPSTTPEPSATATLRWPLALHTDAYATGCTNGATSVMHTVATNDSRTLDA